MSELLPCPFCGWGDPSWHVEHFAYEFEEYAVHCGNCDAESAMLRTREEAAIAWNRRTPRYSHRNGETDVPTVAGAYWFDGYYFEEDPFQDIVELADFGRDGLQIDMGFDPGATFFARDRVGRWYGPIESPLEKRKESE